MSLRTALSALVSVTCLMGVVRAGSAPPTGDAKPAATTPDTRPQECKAGQPCACPAGDACERTCVPDPKRPNLGCDFSCAGTGSCTFHCPEGHCSSRSSGSGATELTCEGGDCRMACSGAGTCELNDCRSGCHLSCLGSGVCENECTGPGCACTGKSCQ